MAILLKRDCVHLCGLKKSSNASKNNFMKKTITKILFALCFFRMNTCVFLYKKKSHLFSIKVLKQIPWVYFQRTGDSKNVAQTGVDDTSFYSAYLTILYVAQVC